METRKKKKRPDRSKANPRLTDEGLDKIKVLVVELHTEQIKRLEAIDKKVVDDIAIHEKTFLEIRVKLGKISGYIQQQSTCHQEELK